MPVYLTVRDLTVIFKKSERTIWRWLSVGQRICFNGLEYVPMKDPRGHCWRFMVKKDNGSCN